MFSWLTELDVIVKYKKTIYSLGKIYDHVIVLSD